MAVDDRPQRRARPFTLLFAAGCILLSVLVVLLARQNLSLKERLAAHDAPAAVDTLQPGDRLGSLVLIEEDGGTGPVAFAPAEERTLLLFFSSSCPACLETLPQWERLLFGVSTGPPRIVGVQVDVDSAPADVSFPLYRVDREGSAALRQIPFVPATVLLDPAGVVESIWFGVLDNEAERRLAAWLAGGVADAGQNRFRIDDPVEMIHRDPNKKEIGI